MKNFTVGLLLLLMLILSTSVSFAAQRNCLHSWDEKITPDMREDRFVILEDFSNEAVLDKETGLVWERLAGDTDGDGDVDFEDRLSLQHAVDHCYEKTTGGRMGWRLPAASELLSLIDPRRNISPTLPSDHPFEGVQDDFYSSSTVQTFYSLGALTTYAITFKANPLSGQGTAANHPIGDDNQEYVWCVRGPSSGLEGK